MHDGMSGYQGLMTSVKSILDTLLDRAVVPGYSRIGSFVRSQFWGADPAPFAEPIDVVVTGGSSGLGAATAMSLAKLGARVHIVDVPVRGWKNPPARFMLLPSDRSSYIVVMSVISIPWPNSSTLSPPS